MAGEDQKELNEPSLSPYPNPVQTPAEPIKTGNKYVCPHCQAEVPMRHDCPTCKAEIDWTKI
jgi:hypothetical protein